MKRVAALYDIHGNLPALEAVLREVREVDAELLLVGGDVFPGPMAHECLTLLGSLAIPTEFIRGNGDRAVLDALRGIHDGTLPEAARTAVRWNADGLDEDDALQLARWPVTRRVDIDGLEAVRFCHATPRNDTDVFTQRTADEQLRPIFAGVDEALVVCGHTHMQFDRVVGPTRVVNAGSVGMPFGQAGAYWLLLGPGVELRRTSYDRNQAAERIRATSYPHAAEFALRNVLQPQSVSGMLDLFGRVEVK